MGLGSYHRWTPEQLQFLEDNHDKLSMGELVDALSAMCAGWRTKMSVYSQAYRMGLKLAKQGREKVGNGKDF